MNNTVKYQAQLESLRDQYQNLEIEVSKATRSTVVNHFLLSTLHKKRETIKEQISRLESVLLDSIVA